MAYDLANATRAGRIVIVVGRAHHTLEKDLTIMTSRTATTSSARRTRKAARLSAALGKAWTDARLADRRLMEIRTDLSRHSG